MKANLNKLSAIATACKHVMNIQYFCPEFWERLNKELRFFCDGRCKLNVIKYNKIAATVQYKKTFYFIFINKRGDVVVELNTD